MLAIWSLVPMPFLKPAWTSGSSRHILLKPGLENFEHCFASMWDECSCVVVGTFFGFAFLWDWNENWPFPVLWPQLCFLNFLAYWVQNFHSIIFQDLKLLNWNSITSTALFIVMLSKAHLTSHSRMSGSRWVITPSWLYGSWRSFLYNSSAYSLKRRAHKALPRVLFYQDTTSRTYPNVRILLRRFSFALLRNRVFIILPHFFFLVK